MSLTNLLAVFSAFAGLGISSANAATFNFTNASPIHIVDQANAVPFPSSLVVSGVSGTVTGVTVTLTNLTHSTLSDVDILLVGPQGNAVLILSAIGDQVTDATLTFQDGGPSIPVGDVPSGLHTYGPTQVLDLADFSAIGFPGPYSSSLADFAGKDPNGTWRLYVVDAAPQDDGEIAGGYTLAITTTGGVSVPDSGSSFTLLITGLGVMIVARRNRVLAT